MVRLHPSFPSQWCGCTFFYSQGCRSCGDPPSLLNGTTAPFYSLSMVQLHLSHVLESSSLLLRLSFCSSWFYHSLYGKYFFPCNAYYSPHNLHDALQTAPYIFPQNQLHSSTSSCVFLIHFKKKFWSFSVSSPKTIIIHPLFIFFFHVPNPPFQNHCGPFPWASFAHLLVDSTYMEKPLTSLERASNHPHAAESPYQKYSPSSRTSLSNSTFPMFPYAK